MARLRVYVAGAYSAPNVIGVLDNMRRGMLLAYKVLKAGFAPFVPWFDYHFSLMGPVPLEEYLEYSMAWLEASDVILVQPEGAEESEGTQAEIARAKEIGVPIAHSVSGLEGFREAAKSPARRPGAVPGGGSVFVRPGTVLEEWEYWQIVDYFRLVLRKIERGRAEYGMDYLKRTDASFQENIEEELADLSGWSAMRYCKLHAPEDAAPKEE